ncbi:oogenesin-3-like [Peromyscus californicus insignis]|uniref:oogenesin-3-like n=1 Tax=Peromyscus californicus insignis TaxID=564181 RepID=UPI0022A779E9|nr:oogenesin-3-like [Peromyscus californicus insignis]
MGDQAPPTLMQLARQRLLREEDLTISILEDLPVELLQEMFQEAFNDRRTNILRAMVSAWPFPDLSVRALIKDSDLETLKALLDGLDVLITDKVHPRRSKLRVLDLADEDHEFWRIRAGTHEGDCSPQAERQEQPVEISPNSGVKKRFKVVTDLELIKTRFNPCDWYLLQWAQQRNDSIHVCCRKLKIWDSPVFAAVQIFKFINLDCILELQLSQWSLEFMVQLFPYLEQMKNLHTLELVGIRKPLRSAASAEQEWISMLLSQISRFPCLQNLSVHNIYFLTGCLEKWLRYLKTPLKTLAITACQLSQSDLDYLSQCLNICELKHLHLIGVELSDSCPKLLGVLLERISSTLQTLELEECEMRDCHFNAILPSLSQCSQLTVVNFCNNNISLLVLKKLLHHTAKLSTLTHEKYPAPLECYEELRILKDKFKLLCPELLDILRAERQPKKVSFSTRTCLNCFHCCFYNLEVRLFCLCP